MRKSIVNEKEHKVYRRLKEKEHKEGERA